MQKQFKKLTNRQMTEEINKLKSFSAGVDRGLSYIHKVLTFYIEYNDDVKGFQEYLSKMRKQFDEEKANANKKESGELRKGSGTNRSTGNNKQATNKRQEKTVKSSNSTKKSTSIKDTSESGNIGL